MRDFVQAGAERFQYELIRSIDKETYKVEVYVPLRLNNADGLFPSEYYYPLVREHVNQITFVNELRFGRLLGFINQLKLAFGKKNPLQHVLDFAAVRLRGRFNADLKRFLGEFDVILCAEYDYGLLKDSVNDTDRVVTLVMSASAQTLPLSPFEDYDSDTMHHLVFDYGSDLTTHELKHFRVPQHNIKMPLVLDCSGFQYAYRSGIGDIYRIAVFTRISPLKPIDPFIYALHLLKVRSRLNVKLHIIGSFASSGISAIFKAHLDRNIKILGLEGTVVFEGHQLDMESFARKVGVDLVWQQSFDCIIGGYAGLELMLHGYPHSFYDFGCVANSEAITDPVIPCFDTLDDFVQHSEHLLRNRSELVALGKMQREHIMADRDVYRHLPTLYAEFDRLAAKPR